MKKWIRLCGLTLLLLLAHASAPAEEARYTLDYRGARIEDVLRALTAQAGVGLVASDKVSGTVTLRLKDVTFDEAMRYLAEATGITYSRSGNMLSVNPQGVNSRTFNLHYVNASAAKEMVGRMLGPLGSVEVFTGTTKDDLNRTVGLDPRNMLLVRDNLARLDEIARVLAELDKAPRQIMIEAKLVEVALDNEDRLGFDWSLAGHVSGASMPTTFPFDKAATGGSFTPTPKTQGDFSQQTGDFPPGQEFPYAKRDDFTFGKLSASEFRLAMEFLMTRGTTNLVSAPKITTLDNKPAEILVGRVVPIALYQNSTLTGALQLSGYEEKKIGVKLSVNPRVCEDGSILMSVHPEVSEIVQFVGQFNERPVTANREASTEVRVKDGETLVIGGLVSEVDKQSLSKVPFLGDIPGIGELFKHRSSSKQKVDLLVFVTPHVLPN